MKNVLRLLVFAALVTVFALPSYAQDAAAAPAPAAQGPCTEAEAKAALYNEFRANFKGTPEQQKVAYDKGKEYLNKYGACTGEGDPAIIKYIQNWVGKYEAEKLKFDCTNAANNTPEKAFEACQPWIAADRENLKPHLALVAAGIGTYMKKDNSLNARAAAEARTALDLIDKGKTTDVWAPFTNQQDAAAGLRYYIAAWTVEANPAEAATQLLSVAKSNSSLAKDPATFQLYGTSLLRGDVSKLQDEYKAKCEGKDASNECDILLNKFNYALDRVIDAYARAVALSAGKPQQALIRTALETYYKSRHEGKTDGLNELISGVLAKPLPLPGGEPPLPAPTSTAADGNGTTGTATPTTPAGGTPPAKPAATPTPQPKPATTTPKPPKS
ncbi:MAG: hypothetical protein JOZ96_11835 [Acidobacteria bacterium]|nr:hypothetical protein [Acidobacteriota bacterium]